MLCKSSCSACNITKKGNIKGLSVVKNFFWGLPMFFLLAPFLDLLLGAIFVDAIFLLLPNLKKKKLNEDILLQNVYISFIKITIIIFNNYLFHQTKKLYWTIYMFTLSFENLEVRINYSSSRDIEIVFCWGGREMRVIKNITPHCCWPIREIFISHLLKSPQNSKKYHILLRK